MGIMPVYVSMVNWSGSRRPSADDIRRAMRARDADLRVQGLRSLAFLSDEEDCAAVMVCTCDDVRDVVRLAAQIHPAGAVRVESMRFDDDNGAPSWVVRETTTPPPAHDLRAAPRSLARA